MTVAQRPTNVGQEEYKRSLRRVTAGLTIVTVASPGGAHGMTASSVTSVSLEPPLVLVCLAKASRTRALIGVAQSFAVNVLAVDQLEMAREFASTADRRFEEIPHHLGLTGAPLLDGAIGRIECRIDQLAAAGDHDIVVGLVVGCDTSPGQPLVYFDGDYRAVTAGFGPAPLASIEDRPAR